MTPIGYEYGPKRGEVPRSKASSSGCSLDRSATSCVVARFSSLSPTPESRCARTRSRVSVISATVGRLAGCVVGAATAAQRSSRTTTNASDRYGSRSTSSLSLYSGRGRGRGYVRRSAGLNIENTLSPTPHPPRVRANLLNVQGEGVNALQLLVLRLRPLRVGGAG